MDSDVEDVGDILDCDEEAFEPAGELEVESESDDEEQQPEEPASKRPNAPRGGQWRKRSGFTTVLVSEGCNPVLVEYPELALESEFSLWHDFCTLDLITGIGDQTNIYANRDKNRLHFFVTPAEHARFFGILLLSGLPREADYWSNQPNLGVAIVRNAMSRNTFQGIISMLHFVDNSALPEGNKVAKVEPLYNDLNAKLVQFGMFHPLLSVDESMVPYYGRHSSKIFIRGKPICFGFKLWSLCGSDGYPYHLRIFKGKETTQQALPLGTRVVNTMTDVIKTGSHVDRHELYFDNFFTSHQLMKSLASEGIRATGTVRENRTGGAGKLMTDVKTMKKSGRGSFDYRSDGDVHVVRWNDNSVVNVASKHETHEHLHKVGRKVKGASNVKVKQPKMIRSYDKGMGGVDLMDRLLSSYRPKIRGKKWYWPLFANYLNLTVVAAWRLHCEVAEQPVTHLGFRRRIIICLLMQTTAPRVQSRGGMTAMLPDEVRFDGFGQNKVSMTQGRYARRMLATSV